MKVGGGACFSLLTQSVCAPTATFSFSRVVVWVIRYHISMHYSIYTRNIIYCVKNVKFFRALTASWGGGGGTWPPALPPPKSGTGLLTHKLCTPCYIMSWSIGTAYFPPEEGRYSEHSVMQHVLHHLTVPMKVSL